MEAINERINYLEKYNQEETTRNIHLKNELDKKSDQFKKLEELNQKLSEDEKK